MSQKILLTGASGFVGGAVMRCLHEQGYDVLAALRQLPDSLPKSVSVFKFSHLDAYTDWTKALTGVDTVIHCAARVHIMNDISTNPLADFRAVNVEATLNLARQAVDAGVRRFVFLSSIKVNGENTTGRHPYTADELPAPTDAYGISKQEAEAGLRIIAEETGLEVVIIRPVLVYGPGVKANFRAMIGWLDKGIPLPFGAINNRRSLVALENLTDLVSACIQHPAAANQTFLVSDGEDLSTTALLDRMSRALGRNSRLIPIPVSLLQFGARMLGKEALSQRLFGSLQVDIKKTRDLLGWIPPISVDQGLELTARDYQDKAVK